MADHQFDHWVVCVAYFAISSGVLSYSEPERVTKRPVWMDWVQEAHGPRGGRRRV